jgi:hypothetical protein
MLMGSVQFRQERYRRPDDVGLASYVDEGARGVGVERIRVFWDVLFPRSVGGKVE